MGQNYNLDATKTDIGEKKNLALTEFGVMVLTKEGNAASALY